MIEWIALTKRQLPPLHQGVLIRTIGAGPTYDVACYIGRNPKGDHAWIMSDISIDHTRITHYALINEPYTGLPTNDPCDEWSMS